MANEQQYQLPDGQLLNAETITNLYLYSQETTPNDNELLSSDLIRPELDLENLSINATDFSGLLPANATVVNTLIDAEPYMSLGPGRFANGSQFDLVRAFFGLGKDEMLTSDGQNFLVENVALPPGSYTKKRINELLFQANITNPDGSKRGLKGFSSSLELRNYRDNLSSTDIDQNGVSEYAELVYIWNSTAFAISDNARFVVNPNGTKEIIDFVIQPNLFKNPKSRENFDFATANPILELGSELILEPLVDPSEIGRPVFVDFYDRQNVPLYDPDKSSSSVGVYDIFDFNLDLITEETNFEPTSIGVIPAVTNQATSLFDKGVTRFLFNDKPILYGTVNNDILVASALVDEQLESTNVTLREEEIYTNGVVLLGGKGNDLMRGDAFTIAGIIGRTDDILAGHEGNDIIFGGRGKDLIYGQKNNDRIMGEGGNDVLRGDLGNDTIAGGSDNDNIFGGSGKDLIYGQKNNDRIMGEGGNDILRGDLGNDIIAGGSDNDNIFGGSGKDLIYGQKNNDRIMGEGGNDILRGDLGNDTITGGAGNDVISGGSGNDRFLFDTGVSFSLISPGRDIITDFDNGNNRIVLDKSTFDALNSQAGSSFSDTNDFAIVSQDSLVSNSQAFIVYSTGSDGLFYNENASSPGLGDGGLFATFINTPTITANDFIITN